MYLILGSQILALPKFAYISLIYGDIKSPTIREMATHPVSRELNKAVTTALLSSC